jgi:hypothetical protein
MRNAPPVLAGGLTRAVGDDGGGGPGEKFGRLRAGRRKDVRRLVARRRENVGRLVSGRCKRFGQLVTGDRHYPRRLLCGRRVDVAGLRSKTLIGFRLDVAER